MKPPAPVTRIRVLFPISFTPPKSLFLFADCETIYFCCVTASIQKLFRNSKSRNRGGLRLPELRLPGRVDGLSFALYSYEFGIAENHEIKQWTVPAQFVVKERVQGEHAK